MSDSDPDLTRTQSAEREWVMLMAGERITAVHGHGAFRRAINDGSEHIRPKIRPRQALYVLAEPDGVIRAVCAFSIGFTTAGRVRTDVELPLRELALRSGDGPDLGWGCIRLACASQCSRPELQEQLWGERTRDLLPTLVAAQRLLRERGGGQRHCLRAGPAPTRRAPVVAADATTARAFGATGVLDREQLEYGRRLAAIARAEHAANAGETFTRAEVEALRARDRLELSRLAQEVEVLRGLLRAELPD